MKIGDFNASQHQGDSSTRLYQVDYFGGVPVWVRMSEHEEKKLSMSFRPEILKSIIGKTIAGIVVRESKGAGPRYQLFMVFTDNTYLEFYGDMNWTNYLEAGDVETVRQYANRFGGYVMVIVR